MGLFQKFREGLQKTHSKLTHEIKRIVTGSPRMTGNSVEELESVLLGADFGMAMATEIAGAVRKAYESQGRGGLDVFDVAQGEVEKALSGMNPALIKIPEGLTVVSLVGVNGTGKTTTSAKLAW